MDGSTIVAGSTPTARRPWLAAFAACNALAAWGGALALATGAIDLGDTLAARLPFASPVLAGMALAVVVAVPLSALAWSAWTASPRTSMVALATGSLLIAWIVVQVAVLRAFSLFQPAYLGVGIALVVVSGRVHPSRPTRGALLATLGTVLAAAGVGLIPFIIDTGVSMMSAVAVVLLVCGLALLAIGVRDLVAGRRPVTRGAGVVGAVVVLVVGVWVIAPGVAATHVPPSAVTTTPADVGLRATDVELTTSDGVPLAAWYVAGTSDAALVVLHGAGSTRSDVMAQSKALADAGYSVLLVDARGHGASGGTAMDFGWYGDLDVTAAVEYLSDEVGAARIGVVGFSMGGEEAIGAAARLPAVRAVVAEGATGRQADDKDWYSQRYGWRGWLQEQVEVVQFAIADLCTEASPPATLRDAVREAPNTQFLLITAGNVDDEGYAADDLRAAAPSRVEVFTVPDADHIGGFGTEPGKWLATVTEFLDRSLG
jgi:pimeloyl-ACP methyl ester carboxylesterase